MPHAFLILVLGIGQTSVPGPSLRCGSYCLYVSLKGLGFSVESFDEVEDKLGQPTASGYSMGQLDELARSYGAHTLGVQTTVENLQRRPGQFACIARIDRAHFVNVARISQGQVHIIDPPKQYPLPVEELRSRWDGRALLISAEPLVAENTVRSRSRFWIVTVLGAATLLSGFGIFVGRGIWSRSR